LLFGQSVSQLGSQISQFAFPVLVLAITGQPAWAGFAGGLVVVPYLVFSLPAGALVDRWDRKRVMIICDMGRFVCLISIPLAIMIGHLTLMQLCISAILEGTFFTFFNIAESACLPRLVSSDQLGSAVSANQTLTSTSYALGPALGGILLGLSRAFPFLVDALSYLISIGTLFGIKAAFQEQRETVHTSLWVEIKEGLGWLWHHSLIRFLAILACVGNGIANGILLLFILLATRLHASPALIGGVYAVAGGSAILGAAIAGPIQKRFRLGQIMLVTQWATVIVLPFYLLAMSNLILLGLATALLSFFGSIEGVVQFTYRLALIPDELQGRVNSVFRLIAYAGAPLFFMAIGVLFQLAGGNVTILILTALVFVLALMTTRNAQIRQSCSS